MLKQYLLSVWGESHYLNSVICVGKVEGMYNLWHYAYKKYTLTDNNVPYHVKYNVCVGTMSLSGQHRYSDMFRQQICASEIVLFCTKCK